MTRLWYPLTHSSDSRRLVAVSPARRDFQDIFLELAGIDANRILWVEQPTRFRSVTVPEQASHSWAESDCFHREAQLVPFERIRTSAIERSGQRAFKRIYLSRSALSGRRVLVGQGYFEEFYALHGYEVVFPEQLPLTEQIALIGRADEIVCTMGTLAHFGLFAKPGARLTILLVHSHKVLKPQAWINRMKSLDWRIVDVDQSCLPVIPSDPTVLAGPSLIGPTNAFHDYVHDCFSEEIRVRVSEELPAYVEAWLEYCLAEYWQIQSFTVFDILNGFSLAIHKKALDEKWLELATLRKLESDLEKKLAEKGALRNRTIAGRSKNVLPYPYPRRGPYHRDGIDWVDLGDGRIDAYGTAECETTYELTLPLVKTSFMTHGRRYVFFIGVDGASIDTYYLSGAVANRDGTPGILLRNLDTGTGRAGFSSMFIGDTRGFEYFGRLYIVVKEGVRLDHVVFQPMICRVEDYDGM